MAVIKVLKGESEYRDENAIRDVVEYAVNSLYLDCYRCSGVVNIAEPEYAINAFKYIQNYYGYTEGVHLHHIVLGLREEEEEIDISDLAGMVTDYFNMFHVQCIAAGHYRSGKRSYYPHLHVIINHIKLDGMKFYGDNDSYYRLADYLTQRTGRHFNVCWGGDGL